MIILLSHEIMRLSRKILFFYEKAKERGLYYMHVHVLLHAGVRVDASCVSIACITEKLCGVSDCSLS